MEARKTNLPLQPTRFIGRERELMELMGLISSPSIRLITLVGPGGTGKTRLAIEAAERTAGAFRDGAHFIPLESTETAEFFAVGVADGMKIALIGQGSPQEQLVEHLRNREALLVLDNFEQLVDAANVVNDLMRHCEGLKLIATSRVTLDLSGEWVLPVPGLEFPDTTAEDPESFDAVKLFVERARRVKRDYSPQGDWDAIANVARVVQGMPLAIELAAAWTKVLPAQEIAAEIERDADFLATTARDVPERHRTMRAVFDRSWALLPPEEQRVFACLSVLHGAFDRKAAAEVCGASLPVLSSLVDKSLLRPDEGGRYRVHELLRQYAREKVLEAPERAEQLGEAHAAYFTRLMDGCFEMLQKGRQLDSATQIEANIENVRSAYDWLVEHRDASGVATVIRAIWLPMQIRGRYPEAIKMLERAAAMLRAMPLDETTARPLSYILTYLAWFYLRIGRIDDTEAAAKEARGLMQRFHLPPPHDFASDPALILGIVGSVRGAYADAERYGQEALAMAEGDENPFNLPISCYVLARAAYLEGRNEAGLRYAQRALDGARRTSDRWFMAYCLLEMGNGARALADYEAASAHYRESYALRQEFADLEGQAYALNHLGEVALRRKAWHDAIDSFAEAMANYREIHDRGGLAAACRGYARAAAATGQAEQANQYFREALEVAAALPHVPLLLWTLVALAEVLIEAGQTDDAVTIALAVKADPRIAFETQQIADEILAGCDDRPGSADDLRDVLSRTLSMTSASEVVAALTTEEAATAEPRRSPSYPNDLTEREVEVLRLVATGKSNRDIAEELFITPNTVANHIKNILSKTESANRTEAAAFARDRGLL